MWFILKHRYLKKRLYSRCNTVFDYAPAEVTGPPMNINEVIDDLLNQVEDLTRVIEDRFNTLDSLMLFLLADNFEVGGSGKAELEG
jgi:hypothetical protein